MTIKHIAIITLIASSLTFFGCADETQKESELIERATTETPVLTSTAALPEPAEAPAPKAETPEEKAEKAPDAKLEKETPDAIEKPKELPKPEATSPEPVVESVDGLTIQRFVTTSQIEEREPVAIGSTFSVADERIYAFVDASNESTSAKSVMVHFVGPEGKVSGGIELVIPASVPRWRTWAYTRYAKKPGSWRVEIRDVNGSLIGALPFEVEPEL